MAESLTIDPKFIVNLHGREFVLGGGLLDLGHRAGLRGITTEVLTELCRPDKDSWVVQATLRFRDEQGQDALWTGLGDASPLNSQMKGAYLRHAETRAVLRALRLATNVAMCSVEELDGEETARPNGRERAPEPRQEPQRARQDPQDHAERKAALEASGAPVCEWLGCNRKLTPGQATFSRQRYEAVLCPEHQKAQNQPSKEPVAEVAV